MEEKNNKLPDLTDSASKSKEIEGIFSQDEIRNIVKQFIAAYLRGELTIEFRTAGEILQQAKFAKRKINIDAALDEEVACKKPFYDMIAVCTGSTEASPQERQTAIFDLFNIIVILRSSGRLKGNLMSSNIEERLERMETELVDISKVVKELVIFYRSIVESRHRDGDQHG
jgi:hypothetical protein